MKKFVITENEKNNILGMYKTRSTNYYLMEQSGQIISPQDAYEKLNELEDGTEGVRNGDNIEFGDLTIGPIGFNDPDQINKPVTKEAVQFEQGPAVKIMQDGEGILLFSKINNFEFMKLGA